MSNPSRTEEDVTKALMAVIAWAGSYSAASKALKSEEGLGISPTTLKSWATNVYAGRYEELRDKYSDQLEKQIIGRYRDNTAYALDVERLALEKAHKRLTDNEDQDPGRTAANAARVAQANTDKMLSLSGRPTSIREDRNLEEIMRSLAAKGIISLPESAVQELPAGDTSDVS